MKKKQFALWVVLSLVVTVASANNLDVERPVLREVSDVGSESLFGYSMVLHQTTASPSNMAEALNGVRYVLSRCESLCAPYKSVAILYLHV